MGVLVEGEWKTDGLPRNRDGRFVRSAATFRGRVTADGSSGYPAEAGRYHLYVSWACPWAHRTVILRKLKGLEEAISLSSVEPFMGEDGWSFSEDFPDHLHGARFLREVYTQADPGYTGRATTPVPWDGEEGTIVNNEFEAFATTDEDF